MAWEDIQAKLERLGGHLDSIKGISESYLSSDALGVANDFAPEPGVYLVKAFVRDAPPKSYSVLVGEMLYHLRSILDYASCQLTEDAGNVPTPDTAFPIWLKPTGFGRLGDSKAWNFKRIGKMRLEHQEVIRDEQPFQLRFGSIERVALTWLYHLSNIDRHRFLHVVATTVVDGYLGSEFQRG